MKKSFWKSDWFAGLIISLAFLVATDSTFLQSLERKAYDLGVQASPREAGDKSLSLPSMIKASPISAAALGLVKCMPK